MLYRDPEVLLVLCRKAAFDGESLGFGFGNLDIARTLFQNTQIGMVDVSVLPLIDGAAPPVAVSLRQQFGSGRNHGQFRRGLVRKPERRAG